MASFRNMRIMNELKKAALDKSDDMTLSQCNSSDFSKLVGSFKGFENTPYEEGCYNIEFELPEDYPHKPPKAKLMTRVWHPNISSVTGYICLDLLTSEKWIIALSLKNVMTSIKALLILAQPDDPQDAVVASQYMTNKDLFEKTASYWNHVYAGGPFKEYFNEMNEKVDLLSSKGYTRDEAIHQLSMKNWIVDLAD